MDHSKILEYKYKYYVSFVLLLALTIMCFLSYNKYNNKQLEILESPKDYNELVKNKTDKEGDYVFIEITYISTFAKYNNDKYYFVQDAKGYTFIVKLDDKTFDDIYETYNDDIKKFSYLLYGFLFEVPDNVKLLAIDVFEDRFGVKLTSSTYDRYLPSTYLDYKETPYSKYPILFTIFGIAFISFTFYFLILCIIDFINKKKYFKKYGKSKLINELASSLIHFEDYNLYITKNYIFVNLKTLKVFEINKIKYIYEYQDVKDNYIYDINLCYNDKEYNLLKYVGKISKNKIINEIVSKNDLIKVKEK